jgi:hypothetical protein
MGTWMNNDGLYIKYGTDRSTAAKVGAFETLQSGMHVIEANLNLTELTASAAIVSDSFIVPKGWTIMRAEIIATTAATSGGAAVLNVGIQRRDRSTEIDYDGIIAALALTSIDTKGETTSFSKGGTSAGALVGTVTDATYTGYLTADYDTAAYTAGVVKVRIFLQKL